MQLLTCAPVHVCQHAEPLTWHRLDVRADGAALLHRAAEGHHPLLAAQLHGCRGTEQGQQRCRVVREATWSPLLPRCRVLSGAFMRGATSRLVRLNREILGSARALKRPTHSRKSPSVQDPSASTLTSDKGPGVGAAGGGDDIEALLGQHLGGQAAALESLAHHLRRQPQACRQMVHASTYSRTADEEQQDRFPLFC